MTFVSPNEEHFSLMLSEVLSEIGINDEIIQKRRTSALFRESIETFSDLNALKFQKRYVFGSQSEGSTTLGLKSDIDIMICARRFHVISNWAEWKHGEINLMMVQDETTAPGYCLLQLLKPDAPLPESDVPFVGSFCEDAHGRILLKNSSMLSWMRNENFIQHGPALNPDRYPEDAREQDIVVSHQCKSWPNEGRRWLCRQNVGGWPTAELKSQSEKSGCFLVPVGSKLRGLDELEWRISTSMAERYLMFSINTTQMKCYVLMKMLLKSHDIFKGTISSYMCKTALFYCIEDTSSVSWQDRNLLQNLNDTLRRLQKFIRGKNCPHFIIPENNLMADKFSDEQQQQLLAIIENLIDSNGAMLFAVEIDDVGQRLKMKLDPFYVHPCNVREIIIGELCYCNAQFIHRLFVTLCGANIRNSVKYAFLHWLLTYVNGGQDLETAHDQNKVAIINFSRLVCSSVGSLVASYNISVNKPVPDVAFQWLRMGVDSDVSSGWLKFATVHYRIGNVNETESILRQVEQRYDRSIVMAVGACCKQLLEWKAAFCRAAAEVQTLDCRHIVSYCVCFMQNEISVVPDELKQEFYRSTPEDKQIRHALFDEWMDLAIVDSLPYLRFLQYKTYGKLNNRAAQENALRKLQQTIRDEPNLFHRETALNLLGQCFEQESLLNEAFDAYERSLKERARNNAANFYISRLLSK